MTEKELRRLSRMELLEMFIEQSKQMDELKMQLDEANKELENRTLICKETGNLAEASIMINKVLEATQKAADDYLANLKKLNEAA
jgi:hypothetical protein